MRKSRGKYRKDPEDPILVAVYAALLLVALALILGAAGAYEARRHNLHFVRCYVCGDEEDLLGGYSLNG